MVVTLTALGRRTRAAALEFRTDWLRRIVTSWSDDDLATLATLLSRFAEEVGEAGPPHAPRVVPASRHD